MRYLIGRRLEPYTQISRGDRDLALEWYLWNARLSAALYYHLSAFEICLRNAIDETMTSIHGEDWLHRIADKTDARRPADFRNTRSRGNTESESARRAWKDARKMAGERAWSRIPSHYDAVASSTLGLWVGLLGSRYEMTYWKGHLAKMFNSSNRAQIEREAKLLLGLRNRIAHHDQIILRKKKTGSAVGVKKYLELMSYKTASISCIARLDHALAARLRSKCEFEAVLDEYFDRLAIAKTSLDRGIVYDYKRNRRIAKIKLGTGDILPVHRSDIGEWVWERLIRKANVQCSCHDGKVKEIFEIRP
ncbi:MAG: Abi family protein [Hyphomicrobiaceae bacterium]